MNLKQSIFRKYQDEEGDGEAGAGRRSFLIKKRGSLRAFLNFIVFAVLKSCIAFIASKAFKTPKTFPWKPHKKIFFVIFHNTKGTSSL